MARRNQNSFLKRQKEMERVRRAREKMSRRHGRKDKGAPSQAAPEDASGAGEDAAGVQAGPLPGTAGGQTAPAESAESRADVVVAAQAR